MVEIIVFVLLTRHCYLELEKLSFKKILLFFLMQLEFRGAGQGMGGQWSAAAQVDLGKTFSLFRNTMF